MTPEGHPARSDPGQIVGPDKGRCAHEENARVFHQGPDTFVVHREAGYIDAALHLHGSSHDTPPLHRRRAIYKFVLKLCIMDRTHRVNGMYRIISSPC